MILRFNNKTYLVTIIALLLLLSLSSYSQTGKVNRLTRIHAIALNSYQYDQIGFEKAISKIRNQTNHLATNRKRTINQILKSLYYINESKLDSSLHICYDLLYNPTELNYDDSIMLYQQIGKIYLDLGESKVAKRNLIEALEISQNHKYTNADIINWLISVFMATNQLDSAIYYIKESLLDTAVKKMNNYINLSMRFNDIAEYDSSKLYLHKAYSIENESPHSEDSLFINLALGDSYFGLNDVDSALYFYKKVLIDPDDVPNWYPYVQANVHISEIYSQREEYDSSTYYMNQFFLCPCLDYGTKAWLNQIKADYYFKINNRAKYLFHLKESKINNDSLIIELEENIGKLSDLNISHMGIIEENLRIKSEKNKIIDQKNSAYIGLIVLLILISGIGVIFFIFRSNKKKELFEIKQKLSEAKINELKVTEENLKLDVKNKNIDLSQMATNMVLKREFFIDQKEKLGALIKLETIDLKKALKKHINDFNNYESIADPLSTIQSNIQDVNSKLFLELKDKFPSLTENDIQICVLHLLKLSTKEISIIRNVTPKAIQTARYRIKKKMGLGPDDDIVSYIERDLFV